MYYYIQSFNVHIFCRVFMLGLVTMALVVCLGAGHPPC